jgi:hypothetical protein
MSLYNVDHKAHQAQNDPNAHTALAMQQDEAVKKTMLKMNTVQRAPEAEGEVKIRDRNSDKNKGGQHQRRGRKDAPADEQEAESGDDGGHLNFLA